MSARPVTVHSQSFPFAIGTIGPNQRLQNKEISASEMQSFLDSLSQFYVAVEQKGDVIPAQCVDGRSRADGSYTPASKAAAGTFSAVVGDALTSASYRPKGGTAADHAKAIYAYFQRHGYVGGHDADHANGQGCGCGAEDNLAQILMFIRDKGDEIRTFLQDVGITVDAKTHSHIVKRATALLTESYIVPGSELRDAYISVAGRKSVETLTGPHHEVVLVINTESSTTIDRAKLAKTYGATFQLFELDIHALHIAANALSISPEEAEQMYVAMLYYNVATAAVLADTSLRVAIR